MPKAAEKNTGLARYSKLAWLVSFASFIIGILVSGTTVLQFESNRMHNRRQEVTDLTNQVADDIKNSLSRSLSSTYALGRTPAQFPISPN